MQIPQSDILSTNYEVLRDFALWNLTLFLQSKNPNVTNISGKLLRALLLGALTDKVDDRETFMKGIDYSYYYEQED